MAAEELTPAQRQYKEAEKKFKVTDVGGSAQGVYVTAEAGTGSRYAAVVTRLPYPGPDREGGQHLISLLQPWQTNMVFTLHEDEQVHPDYLLEKLIPRDRTLATIHGGDAAGVVLTVNTAARLFMVAVGKERRALDELMGMEKR